MLQRSKRLLSAMALPLGIGLAVQGSVADASPVTGTSTVGAVVVDVSFQSEVKPILDKYCVTCHGGMYEGEARMEDSLDLTSYEGLMAGSEYGTVLDAGDPESLIIEMMVDGDMPDEGDPVPAELIEVFKTWILEGAKDN